MDMYNNVFNPYQTSSLYPFQTNYNQQPVLQRTEVTKVNGRNGAESMNLAPNSSVLVLDIHDPIVWFIYTDGAGYKSCIPYSITPYQPAETPTMEELIAGINNRLTKIEERINKHESNNGTAKSAERNEWDI